VLASRESVADAGCSAVVERVLERYPDGRLDILTTGLRRFELLSLDEGKSYLRASIDFFDDDETAAELPPGLRERALDAYQALRKLDDSAPPPSFRTPSSASSSPRVSRPRLSPAPAALALGAGTPAPARLVLRRLHPKQQLIASLKRVQPTNGHSPSRFPDSA